MIKTFYKGPKLGKLPACAICGGPGRGKRERLHLSCGVGVWLCEAHRDPEFLTRRSGRDLAASLLHVWRAADCLTSKRSAAISSHLRRVALAAGRKRLPGSYAWPRLRAEAERRFARGEPPRAVIADLRRRHAGDEATVPSLRTMQRWFAEGRWLRRRPDADGDAQINPAGPDRGPGPDGTPPPTADPGLDGAGPDVAPGRVPARREAGRREALKRYPEPDLEEAGVADGSGRAPPARARPSRPGTVTAASSASTVTSPSPPAAQAP